MAAHTPHLTIAKVLNVTGPFLWGLSLSLLLATASLAQPPLTALPTGGVIVSGKGGIISSGTMMTVRQETGRLITEWESFDIGQEAAVQFLQPAPSSIALNRVLSMDASQIFGQLSANGQVFLVNPAGVTFGSSARFDGAGLVISTLAMSNNDFLGDRFHFENDGHAGIINNAGTLRANGGYIAFLAPYIHNSGDVHTNGGDVALIAADRVSLDLVGDGLIKFTIDQGAVDAQINNGGLIRADNGTVLLSAKAADQLTRSAVNNSGIVEARGVSREGGRIRLIAEGGDLTIGGVLDASSSTAQGGRIVATGDNVVIESSARVTANGATSGGEVLVGGSWQNSDPTVYQATTTTVQTGARLEASATGNGDGGTVVVWSDLSEERGYTFVQGTLKAEGGIDGGDGGRIETSGAYLNVSGIDLSASSPMVWGESGCSTL